MNIWIRPERAGRGPAPEHSRASIAAAAIALADTGGLAAVSMRRVAAELGTGAASLYRYVETRDELVELMADTATGELDLGGPPSGDPIADLVRMTRRTVALYLQHPWMVDGLSGRPSLGPHAVDVVEWVLAALHDVDVPGRTKMETFAVLSGFAALFARGELAARGGATSPEWQAAQVTFLTRTIAQGRHPHLAAVLAEGAGAAPDGDLLDRVLPVLLAGLLGLALGGSET